MNDDILDRQVTVRQLIQLAGEFNEEIRDGVNPEYTRGQIELICDAAGISIEDQDDVRAAIAESSDRFYRKGS